MNASLHKLTAGSGYDYLTRQVAVQDTTEKGHASLSSYYSEKGETPGAWLGSGLTGLEDVQLGDVVTADQMQSLFGAGFHPNMAARLQTLPLGATPAEITHASRLGAPFKVQPAVTKFQQDVAIACTVWEQNHPGAGGVPVDVRAEIRNDIAIEHFTGRVGRAPSGLELATEVARLSRDPSTACAGYDVTFTPVKSVSTLWALAPRDLAARIEDAHHAAVADALAFLEKRVLFTRAGAGGVRQLDVTGLVAAGFVHRDSRAGDPNLHTHVAIANKVQTLDGRWLAIDGRIMFKALVAVSETYNTQLEAHLRPLGIGFAVRPGGDPSKRPVREIIGVPAELNQRWSSRRAAIETRQQQLAAKFHHDHHRPPTPSEALKLAQQATLETRDAKHAPRSHAQQRTTWRAEAEAVISPEGIEDMLDNVLHSPTHTTRLDAGWVDRTAAEVVAAVAASRATWQVWHLRAEASRRVRPHTLHPQHAEQLTEQLLGAAVAASLPVREPDDGITEPAALRRLDGSSVYSVAGSRLFTSRTVLGAEERVLAWAGRRDGRRAEERFVSLALLESVANGVTLNQGQARMVHEMATSGARVQLALAAAGSGKTTALRVLAAAWRDAGGSILGLAPSAVAASVLRDQIGEATTIAKLAWDLHHRPNSPLLRSVGADTLVVVDEAGMADTITLARVIDHVTLHGGSVRLVGDDQQLAAITAGGLLRDIADTHGAITLNQIVRFTDPAEAAASLALRDGGLEALGFYLDHHRIHPGTTETSLEAAFHAWTIDTAAGLDSLMLATTNEQVADLNRRARAHRLATGQADPSRTVTLADGNQASVGELIVTRMNDRRLPVSATDWVKNGDRWIIEHINRGGSLVVKHRDSGLSGTLPVAYYSDNVQLGFAVTIHTAQGLTVDTTRGVLTGTESRQQLYVMATRGRHANHIYLPVVGDGDEHSLPHPQTLRPVTAVDILEGILGRDGSARSATTETRHTHDPRTMLGQAAARYEDAIHVATETTLPPETVKRLDAGADNILPGITHSPAWPTLRATLLLNATTGHDPLQELASSASLRELATATDPAAVLTWRIPTHTGTGPLPWLPGIPDHLTHHPQWGPYLTTRHRLVEQSATQVHTSVDTTTRPQWALPGQDLTDSLIRDIETWRAATSADPADRRATGPTQFGNRTRTHQKRLRDRLHTTLPSVWSDLVTDIHPNIHTDPFATSLTARIAALHDVGVPVTEHLAQAVADGPLPAEQPAAALWWRLNRHLNHNEPTPVSTATRAEPAAVTILWADELTAKIGADKVVELEASPWWPHLVTTVNAGLTAGHHLTDLIHVGKDTSGFDDDCQALMWHAQQLQQPQAPVEEPPHPAEEPPVDAHMVDWTSNPGLDAALEQAARLREITEPDFTELQLRQAFAAADRWEATPYTPERLVHINQLAAAYYQRPFANSWAHPYLLGRLGQDLHHDERFRPGYAPPGWTSLTQHLRSHGITDDEMHTVGVTTRTRDGRTIDRFRDRLILPITADGTIVGFVARRNPILTGDSGGPKYLNTPTTPPLQQNQHPLRTRPTDLRHHPRHR